MGCLGCINSCSSNLLTFERSVLSACSINSGKNRTKYPFQILWSSDTSSYCFMPIPYTTLKVSEFMVSMGTSLSNYVWSFPSGCNLQSSSVASYFDSNVIQGIKIEIPKISGAIGPTFQGRPTILVATRELHDQLWRETAFLSGELVVLIRPVKLLSSRFVLSAVSIRGSWKLWTNNQLVSQFCLAVIEVVLIRLANSDQYHFKKALCHPAGVTEVCTVKRTVFHESTSTTGFINRFLATYRLFPFCH